MTGCLGLFARIEMFGCIEVSLRDGVLLLRGANDGHRSNGIGPGEYNGEPIF